MLKPAKFGANEYIFTEGEYANESNHLNICKQAYIIVYFIKSGTVQMVLREFNNFPFMYIEQGYFFGEVDLLFGETRKHCYHAKTDCELLALDKKNFTQIFFQDFRDVGTEIYNNALKRRLRAQKTHKEALSQCQVESKEKELQKKKSFHAKISNAGMIKFERGASGTSNGSPRKLQFNQDNQNEEKGKDEIFKSIPEHENESEIYSKPEVPTHTGISKEEINDERKEQIEEKNWRKIGLKIDTEAIESDNTSPEKKTSPNKKESPFKKRTPMSRWTMLRNNFQIQVILNLNAK